MQEHLFRHFSSPSRNGFLNNVSITLIDKTDPSDPLKREDYWRRTLETMAPFGLNIENNCLISYNGDSAIINIYLAFRSRQLSGLFCRMRFLDLFTIFIVIALRGMKAFLLKFLVEVGFC